MKSLLETQMYSNYCHALKDDSSAEFGLLIRRDSPFNVMPDNGSIGDKGHRDRGNSEYDDVVPLPTSTSLFKAEKYDPDPKRVVGVSDRVSSDKVQRRGAADDVGHREGGRELCREVPKEKTDTPVQPVSRLTDKLQGGVGRKGGKGKSVGKGEDDELQELDALTELFNIMITGTTVSASPTKARATLDHHIVIYNALYSDVITSHTLQEQERHPSRMHASTSTHAYRKNNRHGSGTRTAINCSYPARVLKNYPGLIARFEKQGSRKYAVDSSVYRVRGGDRGGVSVSFSDMEGVGGVGDLGGVGDVGDVGGIGRRGGLGNGEEKGGIEDTKLLWCNGLRCNGLCNTAYCTTICIDLWQHKVQALRQQVVLKDILQKRNNFGITKGISQHQQSTREWKLLVALAQPKNIVKHSKVGRRSQSHYKFIYYFLNVFSHLSINFYPSKTRIGDRSPVPTTKKAHGRRYSRYG